MHDFCYFVFSFTPRNEVVGTLILSESDFKKKANGKTEHLRMCKKEEERVEALEDVFRL